MRLFIRKKILFVERHTTKRRRRSNQNIWREKCLLLENVPGLQMYHLTVDPPQEPAIAHVVHELESLGYSWAHRIISLSAFGLPQRRHRVFIVATLHGDPRDVLLSTESICKGQCINLSKAESKEKSPAECYECFMTPPHVTPTISVTCVDLADSCGKRESPCSPSYRACKSRLPCAPARVAAYLS